MNGFYPDRTSRFSYGILSLHVSQRVFVLRFHFWCDTKSVGVIVLKATPLLLPVSLCFNTSVPSLD